MAHVLYVSNGHGESAIAERIACEMHGLDAAVGTDHLPLVGEGTAGTLRAVGPRRRMPSGGLVAMGNVRAFALDVRAGFPALFLAQLRFLRGARRTYDLAVVAGDAYALGMALVARLRTVFVGTAKSAYVAPYGRMERRILRRAALVFVRDERTAAELRARGVPAEFPGNVIADLRGARDGALPRNAIGLLPGSRIEAYRDAVRLGAVLHELAQRGGPASALLSVAPTLEAESFAAALQSHDWTVQHGAVPKPFTATKDGARIVAWTGELGDMLASSAIVLGQAGTANEAAASAGIPVVALEDERGGGSDWYRMRQRRLLGDALAVVPAQPDAAADAVRALMDDPARMERMRRAGLQRMGNPGGARRIAASALSLLRAQARAS